MAPLQRSNPQSFATLKVLADIIKNAGFFASKKERPQLGAITEHSSTLPTKGLHEHLRVEFDFISQKISLLFTMAFTLSSNCVALSGSTLSAQCGKGNGEWVTSTIDLNDYLGNQNGTFDMETANWFASAVHEKTSLEGSLLHTVLYDCTGKENPTCLNLNLCIANIFGTLTFCKTQKPNDSILMSASCLMLSQTTLKAVCIGNDGMPHVSEIDLNSHYANKNASFVSDDKHFAYTARNLQLEVANSSITLKAELKDYDRVYRQASVDLAICIVNKNGRLTFERHDGWFDRDGAFTKWFEHFPILGFVIAGIHTACGNGDQATRALAVCTNSSIVCAGIVIGATLGGPLGAAVGAGLATPIGILAEEKIVKVWVKNPGLKAKFEEATIGRYIYETLRNMAGAAIAGYLAEWLGSLVAADMDAAVVALLKKLGSSMKFLADISVYALFKFIVNLLRNEATTTDWDKVEKTVYQLSATVS